ncbi:carotenoid 1,2-hydratase [Acidovorax sp. SUPP3434]|uniref:lipocalin-like domain-containing protein n=1 Tax=Acidovorax sp. SUPP3434 TaxID=2920880 RepID=UPI0023DE2B5F|nr:carotenoid 1,2-hydratase [Acidovorax sp. SUPP3434]GKT00067.1 carotenoid 1,2-hydratase [Acidovorax sp. SUPP3434]
MHPMKLPAPPAPPAGWTRRAWLAATALAGGAPWLSAQALAPRTLVFPQDHGSHPALRTEWWYITGQARAAGQLWGFQVTFFRSRVEAAQPLQSTFAAKQLVFAHAALTDLGGAALHHDQRIARAGFGIAGANEADTDVRLGDWTLARTPRGAGSRYAAQVRAADFALDLQFDTTQPVLLQGAQGLSRKGPDATQASYYYSQPQMAVTGHLQLAGRRMALEAAAPDSLDNRAWLDHEWSDALVHSDAVGWDWIGMNLQDGSALTAFRLRRGDGSALWAGGSLRAAGGTTQVFGPQAVAFTPQRHWTSPASQARYPVQWRVDTPAGSFEVHALLDAQELDSQASTGAIYWEGLSELRDGAGRAVGRGYLEMTGYARPLRL